MKIKTKSGFECEVNERRLKDWRYVKAAAKINGGNEADILDAITFAVPFLLEDEGEKALMDHITVDDVADTEKMLAEFLEITQIAGEKAKKSLSSSSS